MSTTHEGRIYNLTEDARDLKSLRADLIARGYDGSTWFGESKPVGRQRVTFHGMFYRKPSGEFVKVL